MKEKKAIIKVYDMDIDIEKSKKIIVSFFGTTKFWVIICAVGIWVHVFYVISHSKKGVQSVYVEGGDVDANITNRFSLDGPIRVCGTVDVGNTVDVNIHKINGQRDVFFNNPARGQRDKYYVLPVTVE